MLVSSGAQLSHSYRLYGYALIVGGLLAFFMAGASKKATTALIFGL
jgi:hypothetical protein